jgi:polyhydroxyalkanoate synthesis regulator phasin
MATKRRKNSITKFLQDVIDDSKELVDDLIERAEDVESNAHDAVRDIVDEDDETPSGDELAELKAALADLTSKVEKLATVKSAK